MTEAFANEPVYAWMAVIGTALFVIKLLLLIMGGETDTDVEVDGVELDDGGHVDGSSSFTIVSIQSVLAFIMGTGWIGLASREEWGLEKLPALLVAASFGFAMMLFSSFVTFKMKSLNSTPDNKIDDRAIGLTGRAYTDIPANGSGMGQIELTINGKMQILQASSQADLIKAFTSIKVTRVDDSGNLTVVAI